MRSVQVIERAGRPAALAVALLVLGGCMVGPDFKRPVSTAPESYTTDAIPAQTATSPVAGGDAQRFVADMDVPAQWWTLFRSEALNDFIAQALKSNPGMDGARAALRMANESVAAQRGAFYPSVDAGLDATRQRNPATLSSPLESNSNYFSLYTAQVSVSYTLDLFGGNRRALESAQAQAEAQRFELEATYLTLTSNVVLAAVQEAGLRAQIDATDRIVASQTKTLATVRRELELGQVAQADVSAQVAALAQAQATIAPLQKQLAQQRDLLATLLGRYPGEKLDATFELSSLQLPQALPLSLPSQLVERRPDVRAAEAQLHAASALIGVAAANRLPKITLSASAGSSPTNISDMFSHGTDFWSVGTGITQPIFHGGSLMHQERAAKAAYDQALAQYRGTVLAAFQNVADTLYALRSDSDALNAALVAEQAASRNLDIARRQAELGDIGELAVLNAEQSYRQAEITLVGTQVNRYADTVALFQALGGGWWNRNDAHSDTSVSENR
jgi:NodT family efflux transporter outer membrane factor (OMF) lipoprotein